MPARGAVPANVKMTVAVFPVGDSARMRTALGIRTRVFVEEQGVPMAEEVDIHDRADPAAVHALVYDEAGVALAAGRFYVVDDTTVQIGRMAVDASARRRGAGRLLLEALCAEARRRGFVRAHLHAQVHALEFYRGAGFFDEGEPLWDAAILHQPMTRLLA